jgi:hypothetical protein
MTKRNFAARRFADDHGTYDAFSNDYTLRPSSRVPDPYDTVSRSRLTAAQNDTQVAYAAQRDALREHAEDLKIVMELLGLTDQYEDTTREVLVRGAGYMPSYYENRVVKTAVQNFADDLRAARSAVEGQAALKRIRKAVKTITKEESK